MKKITFSLIATCMFLSFHTIQLNAATKASTIESTSKNVTIHAASADINSKALLVRLDEIKMMDLSDLKISEKKTLRKEILSIRESLKAMNGGGGGVYISVGGLILVLLLLIIIF